MKTVVRRSLTILMCAGTLIAGTQSWAKDVSTSSATKTVKAQEPCTKPCKMEKDDKEKAANWPNYHAARHEAATRRPRNIRCGHSRGVFQGGYRVCTAQQPANARLSRQR